MTRDEVRTEMENGLGRCESGPEGISYGPMRVESGGGIAGNGTTWWIRFPGYEVSSLATPVGPIRTKAELRRALRETVLRILRWGINAAEVFRQDLSA